jgi:hypothetical protein
VAIDGRVSLQRALAARLLARKVVFLRCREAVAGLLATLQALDLTLGRGALSGLGHLAGLRLLGILIPATCGGQRGREEECAQGKYLEES